MTPEDRASVRGLLWRGQIPLELRLDQAELTTLTCPPPMHCLVPRVSYLPLHMDEVRDHFAGAVAEAQRMLWLEDDETGQPLRWHLPLGVLQDMRKDPGRLPWRVTVHFHRFPHRKVLPFEAGDAADIKKHFMNALKQALFCAYGTPDVAMSMPIARQNGLWEALVAKDEASFETEDPCSSGGSNDQREVLRVPVRICCRNATSTSPSGSEDASWDHSVPVVQEIVDVRRQHPDEEPLSLGSVLERRVGSYRQVFVQGIEAPPHAPILEAWKAMRHPDHFLYITIVK